jgi:hypothetical protein
VHDASFDDDSQAAERQTEFVNRVENERKGGFDLSAAGPQLLDEDALVDGGGARKVSEDLKSFGVTPAERHGAPNYSISTKPRRA